MVSGGAGEAGGRGGTRGERGGGGGEGGGAVGTPEAGQESRVRESGDSDRRMSSEMRAHVLTIKKRIGANIIHEKGRVVAPPGGTGQFPYGGPLILPDSCPNVQIGEGA